MDRQTLIDNLELVQRKLSFLTGQISINTPIIEALSIVISIIDEVEAGPITE